MYINNLGIYNTYFKKHASRKVQEVTEVSKDVYQNRPKEEKGKKNSPVNHYYDDEDNELRIGEHLDFRT